MNTKTAIILYIAAMTAANLLVAKFGVSVVFINAFVLIGLDFFLRDYLHERWVGDRLALRMGALIGAAGVFSYALNPAAGTIAVASFAAFCGSMLVDTFVYQLLIKRSKTIKQNGSNIAGAAVDSLLFPAIAFGGFLPGIVLGQFAAKAFGGFLWSLVLRKRSKTLYLCGPINGRSDGDCKGWREAAKEQWPHETLDPMSRDYRGREAECVDEIVEGDKEDILQCSCLLVYFDKPSVGTSQEILFAWERGIPVVVINKSDKPLSPWLVYHSTDITTSLEAALHVCKARV